MTAPKPRHGKTHRARRGLWLVLTLVLAGTGFTLLADRPGLRAAYFALVPPWEGDPLFTTISEPRLDEAILEQERLLTRALFSVQWTGWWQIDESGRHRFQIAADEGAYLRIDGEVIVDTHGLFGRKHAGGRTSLEPGLHRIEIGYFQVGGDLGLRLDWMPPEADRDSPLSLAAGDLYAGRPLWPRRLARRLLEPVSATYRRLLGVVLLLAAALAAARLRPDAATIIERLRLGDRLRAADGPRLRATLLLALFAATFFATLPFTGAVRAGDDSAYLEAAFHGEAEWFSRRNAHVYLLRGFVFLCGGDPLLATRVWWSFAFAMTIASLAVAVSATGPRLQLATLAAVLFVLWSQNSLLGPIGAAFADHSAMMFVTAAVAVYLHGFGRERDRSPPRYEWHALLLGALTVAALRSKEVGAVVLLLLPLLAISGGRLDLRRFLRRFAPWAAGAACVFLAVSLLDAWILGDFFLFFDRDRWPRAGAMNFPSGVPPRSDGESWGHILWIGVGHPASLTLRYLWVGTVAAAIVAGAQRKRLEQIFVHLLPLAYLLMIIVLFIRLPHPISPRMLTPILPVACLMTGLLLHYAGLDEIPWRRVLAPRWSLPAALVAAVLGLVVIPYRMGRLAPADFLPVDVLARFGWTPELFASGVLLPATVLAASGALCFVLHRPSARLMTLLVLYLTVFGLGFDYGRRELARRTGVQTADLLLYPWRAFRAELEADPPRVIALSNDLAWRYRMSGPTRSAPARLALRRREIYVLRGPELPAEADTLIASRQAFAAWRRQQPSLEDTVVLSPDGLLVLARPGKAARSLEGAATGP